MSRRISLAGLILLIAIWAGVLLTPSLRLLLSSQLVPVQNWNEMSKRHEDVLEKLANEHPNDPRILGARIENVGDAILTSGYRKAQLNEYDALIERFPGEARLIKNRLRLSTIGGFGLKAGELDPQGSPEVTWLSREEILQTLKVTLRGTDLEPQNSFYDWMRAVCLFSLKRDEEALRALHEGATKTDFDDGALTDVNNRILVQQMAKPLLWEERTLIAYSQLLPHLSLLRRTNRAAIWLGVLAERRGNHVRALQIYEDQWKLGRTISRKSEIVITSLVGQAITANAWAGLERRLPAAESNARADSRPENMKILASRFASYARQHGRPDLAYEVAKDSLELGGRYEFGELPNTLHTLHSGRDAREIYRWKWFGTLFLRAFFWCGIAWLVIVLLQGRVITRIFEKSGSEISPSEFDSVAAALFVTIAFGTILIAVWPLVDLKTLEQWILYRDLDPKIYVLENPQGQTLINAFDRWLSLIPLALVIFYVLIAALWRGRKEPNTPGTLSQVGCAISAFVFLLVLPTTVFFIARQTQFAQQMALDAWAIESWLPLFAPVLIFLFLLIYLAFRFGSVWGRGIGRALLWLQGTQLLSQGLYFIMVVLSGAYLLTSVLALPVRHEADLRLDQFLQRGEVALIREATAPR